MASHPAAAPELRLDAFGVEGLQSAVAVLASKWSVSVIGQLAGGTHRFNELLRQIDGVSRRMLAATLRQLEREGVVERRVYAHVPARVEYELSAAGEELLAALAPLAGWAIAHREEVARARERFDRLQSWRARSQELQARTQATPRLL